MSVQHTSQSLWRKRHLERVARFERLRLAVVILASDPELVALKRDCVNAADFTLLESVNRLGHAGAGSLLTSRR